jgi:predicted RNA-binding Zn-ribbon protein involved in translation (DUF1610 family)
MQEGIRKLAAQTPRELVHPDDLDLKCQNCGFEGANLLSRSGPHIKATCINCGRHIRFVRQKKVIYKSELPKTLEAGEYLLIDDSEKAPWEE